MAIVGFSSRCLNFAIKKNFRAPLFVISNSFHDNFFDQLSKKTNHSENKYEYEISKNPEEWKHVEYLLPFETVPQPKPKAEYPSGWRPMNEKSLELPYFVERSKNHMLPVYLLIQKRGINKRTHLKNVHGDLWTAFNELKAYVEKNAGRKIACFVHEGNKKIIIRGDFVYYVEQWLLSKGF